MKGTTSKTGRVSSGSANTQRRRDLHSIIKYWDKEVAVWRSAAVFFWFSIFLWISSVFWNLLFSPDVNSLSSESESPFFVFSFFQFLILVAQLLVLSVKREEPNTKTLQSLLSKIILFIGLFLSILSLTNIANSLLTNQGSDAHYYGTNTLYLDESILFLYFFAILHSIYLTYNFWKREQFVLAFPPIQQGRWFRLKARIPIVAKETIFFGSLAVFIYFLVFLVSKFFIINSIVELYSHFSGQTYHIVQTQSIPYFPLLMTLITSSSFTYFCFQISYHLLNIIFTQVKKFEQNLLISGLNCKSRPIIQYNCFLDLYYLSQYAYQRRANIYSCNTPKKSGDWVEVLQACRSVIDTLTTRLHEIVIHKAEIKRKKTNIFYSIWPFSSTSIWLSKPPGFGRSQMIFSDLQLVVWAIEALSNLIQHSKEEDKSGNVQNTRSIEAALNSLVGCYIATKHYLETDERNPPKMLEESQLISPFTNTLAPTIISAIYRITTTFYRDFGTLTFPEEYSDTLQEFLDFQI